MTSAVHETALHLIFQLGGKTFAIDVSEVRAILALSAMTPAGAAHPGIRGTLFISGTAVPVLDTREKFGVSAKLSSPDACIIVIERSGSRLEDLFGVVVDRVKEVTARSPGDHAGLLNVVSFLEIGANTHRVARHVGNDDQPLSENENAPARSQLQAP